MPGLGGRAPPDFVSQPEMRCSACLCAAQMGVACILARAAGFEMLSQSADEVMPHSVWEFHGLGISLLRSGMISA